MKVYMILTLVKMIPCKSELIWTLFLQKYGKKILLHRHDDMPRKMKWFVIIFQRPILLFNSLYRISFHLRENCWFSYKLLMLLWNQLSAGSPIAVRGEGDMSSAADTESTSLFSTVWSFKVIYDLFSAKII